MINVLTLLLFNILFNNFFLGNIFDRNNDLAISNLQNLQEDFSRISFPVNFSLNVVFISLIVSIFLTLFIRLYVINNLSSDPITVVKNFVKLFWIYSGSLFGIMYLFRLYNLPRGFILLGIIIYPFLAYILISLLNLKIYNKISDRKSTYLIPAVLLIALVAIFVVTRENNNEEISIDSVTTTTTTTTIPFIFGEDNFECKAWLGSDNFKDCILGSEIEVISNFNERVTNIIPYKNEVYIMQNSGTVIELSSQSIFIDLTNKVGAFEEFFESGLFSLAFHPSDEYFLISYSDLENNLVVERFNIGSNNQPDLETSEILVKIPNAQCCHYSGNIIWSDYFEDFLISVGDMDNVGSKINSDPLDTTSPRGKVLFLNKKISNPDLLSVEKNSTPRKDILAYGLRNPWKTFEYKNYLFVPDVGKSYEEELNVVDLNLFSETSKPFLMGWPHFEATIDNDINFNQILLHSNGKSENIKNYILENSLIPNVFYSQKLLKTSELQLLEVVL